MYYKLPFLLFKVSQNLDRNKNSSSMHYNFQSKVVTTPSLLLLRYNVLVKCMVDE